MKAIVKTNLLGNALKVLAAGIGKRTRTMPILANVLIQATLGELKLTIHNWDVDGISIDISQIIPADVGEVGEATTSLKELRRSLPNHRKWADVMLEKQAEAQGLAVSFGGTNLRLDTLPVDDFPPALPWLAYDSFLWKDTLNLVGLRQTLAETLPAVSTDEARIILCCIHTHAKTGRIEAADGFRAHRTGYDELVRDALIPAGMAKALLLSPGLIGHSAIVMEGGQTKTYYYDESGLSAVSIVNSHGYPDLDMVIPFKLAHKLTLVDVEKWQEALAAAVKATEDYPVVKLSFGKDSVTVKASEQKYSAKLPATLETNAPEPIGFNAGFLKDMLQCATIQNGSDPVTLEINVPTTPMVVRNGDSFLGVLMPMFLDASYSE